MLFPVVLLCHFLVLAGNRFWYVVQVQYSCGIVLGFLAPAGNSFWFLRTYLVYNTVVGLCQFCGFGGK